MSPKSTAGFRWTRLPSGPPVIGASQGARLPLAVMLCAGLALAAVDAQAAELTTRLAMRLEQSALKDARVGVMVVRERNGEVLFEHDAERLLIPASNMKIMTSMGALSVFEASQTNFIGAGVLALGFAGYQIFRPARVDADCGDDACAPDSQSRQFTRRFFIVAVVLFTVATAYPYVLNTLL